MLPFRLFFVPIFAVSGMIDFMNGLVSSKPALFANCSPNSTSLIPSTSSSSAKKSPLESLYAAKSDLLST